MKKVLVLFVFVTLITLSPETVKACTCVTSSEVVKGFSLKRWLKEFDGAMFTGRVKEIETVKLKLDQDLAVDFLRVTFQVDKYWKGVRARKRSFIPVQAAVTVGFIMCRARDIL